MNQLKRKLLSIVLTTMVVLNMGLAPVSVIAASSYFPSGDGTLENPYKITTSEQLKHMSDAYNDKNGVNRYYVLQNDIDMSGSGTNIDNFSGTFNGNGHTISNLNGRLVTTNFGTIRNVVLQSPSYKGLTTAPSPEDQMSNYYREIVDRKGEGFIYTQDNKGSVVTYFFKENFGFAAGTNESTGTIDNVTVAGGTINNYYTNNQTITDQDDWYAGMVRNAPGRMGGVVGYNQQGVVSNCTVKGLTVNADSALGVFGGIVGYSSSGEVTGCVTSAMQVNKAGSGTWINSEKNNIHLWAAGAITGYAYGKTQSCYSLDAYCNTGDGDTGKLPAVGFRRASSILDVNTKDDKVLKQDISNNGGDKLTGSPGVPINIPAWNTLVDNNTYPRLKKRDPSNYLKVIEASEPSNQVEVRYYDNTGKFLSSESKARNDTFTLKTYTKSTYDNDGSNTSYQSFVDQYKVTKTMDGKVLSV